MLRNKNDLANDLLDKIKIKKLQKKEEWTGKRKQEEEKLEEKLQMEFRKNYKTQFEMFNEKTNRGLSEINYSIDKLTELYTK